MPLEALQQLEQTIKREIRLFEQRKGIRLDDEVRFIRSWFERPLSTGAVTPSGGVLARTMARYDNPNISGPIVELGPGTGPVTEALLAEGIAPERLVLVEFNATFCQLLRARFPGATVVQGDAYGIRRLVGRLLGLPRARFVSGLPLVISTMRVAAQRVLEAAELPGPGRPFIEFTYAVMPPIPKKLAGVRAEASERIWKNMPPARVWIYRKG